MIVLRHVESYLRNCGVHVSPGQGPPTQQTLLSAFGHSDSLSLLSFRGNPCDGKISNLKFEITNRAISSQIFCAELQILNLKSQISNLKS